MNSLEAADVAFRRGQLAQASAENLSLVAAHFNKADNRGHSAIASVDSESRTIDSSARGSIVRKNGDRLLSKGQAVEMAERITSLTPERRSGQALRTVTLKAAGGKSSRNMLANRGRKVVEAKQRDGGGFALAERALRSNSRARRTGLPGGPKSSEPGAGSRWRKRTRSRDHRGLEGEVANSFVDRDGGSGDDVDAMDELAVSADAGTSEEEAEWEG